MEGGKAVKELDSTSVTFLLSVRKTTQEINVWLLGKGPFKEQVKERISTQGLMMEIPMYLVCVNLDFIIFRSQRIKKFNVFE